MMWTYKKLTLEDEESIRRKLQMIRINRKLRGEYRQLGGDTSIITPLEKNDTSSK